MENNADDFKVGDVVVDEEGFRGTVKYVGAVASAKKKEFSWIGVEWEAAGRGKHDGSVVDPKTDQVHRYFTCKDGQGSFVKPQFLRAGKSFGEALLERYEPKTQEDPSEEAADAGPRRRNGDVVQIEAVGMDAIRNKQRVSKLREVSLGSCAVVSAGSPGWISENCPNIRELDLSDNLIENWTVIGNIIKQLPDLDHLSLARNDLKAGLPSNPIERLPDSLRARYDTLKVLVLNKTGTTFSQIQRLDVEGVFTNLEELVLGDNNLDSLDPIADVKSDKAVHKKGSYAAWAQQQIKEIDRKGFTPESFAKGFRSLRIIDISRNKICSWSEVWRLSRLPALKQINASDNPIETIFFDKPLEVTIEPSRGSEAANDSPEAVQAIKEEVVEKDQQSETERVSLNSVEIDIVMSNGMKVPMLEQKEKARYTEARLFKGDGTGGGSQPFAQLETLLLARTRVHGTGSVDALNGFPVLRELRIQGAPIVTTAPNLGAARQNIIARVRGLLRLNGSDISERERIDAERLYLKRVAMSRANLTPEELNQTEDGFLAENPRYKELVAIHGDPTETAKRTANQDQTGSLSSNSARITIRSFDPRSCTVPPVTKKLPLNMTVKEVKVLCHKLFGVELDLQSLFYRETGKNFGHPTPLDDDNFPIVDFGVKADGEIIMEARDPEKEHRDAEKKAAQEAARMKEQEDRAHIESNIKRQEVEQGKTMVLNQ